MTLTADGGSTKTTWKTEGNGCKRLFRTQGLNPFHQTEEEILRIINDELLRQEGFPDAATVSAIRFYCFSVSGKPPFADRAKRTVGA